MRERSKICTENFIRKTLWERPLGIYWLRWEDNIKMNLKKIGCEDMDWIHLSQHRDQ
jgi:hypothetical protein